MKPPPLAYMRPGSLSEALELLHTEHDAKVLAGGQSLLPLLNLRRVRPALLVDVGRLPGLRHLLVDGTGLRIGALVTHDRVTRCPATLAGFEDARRATTLIGHLPIRTRGTVGGSLAHADPVAEWCVTALLHDGEVVLASVRGLRTVRVADLVEGPFTTSIAADEVLLEVRLRRPLTHAAVEEVARRPGDSAIVSAAAGFDVEDGAMRSPRVVVAGVGPVPARVPAAETVLQDAPPGPEVFQCAGQAAAKAVNPQPDQAGSVEYRRHLAAALVERACAVAWGSR